MHLLVSVGCRIRKCFALLPLLSGISLPAATFEANHGQAPPAVRFIARDRAHSIYLLDTPELASGAARIRFGSLPSTPKPGEPLQARTNYLLGTRPENWITGVPTFNSVEYPNVEPGVSLRLYYHENLLEFDFILQRGAAPAALRLHFSPNVSALLSPAGEVVLKDASDLELLRLGKPKAYQEQAAGGSHLPVASAFRLLDAHTAAFKLGAYDRRQPLIIDPTLIYSTSLGGAGIDQTYGVAVDAQGNTYVAGTTQSPDFPATRSQSPTAPSSITSKVFVACFDIDGNLLYSTILGGSASDGATAIAVDPSGNAFVTGTTQSSDFPVTPNVFQTKLNLSTRLHNSDYARDAFVLKLSPDGQLLIYSTYLGGTLDDHADALAIDETDSAYVIGHTGSFDFPVTPGAFQTTLAPTPSHLASPAGVFVAKLTPDGSGLFWSTYLSGGNMDYPAAIAAGPDHNPVVVGQTISADFPVYNAFDSTYRGGDGFVAKLTADGSALVYSSFVGGTQGDSVKSVVIDTTGNAYLAGTTNSDDFPSLTPQPLAGSIFFGTHDNGATWQPPATGLTGSTVFSLAMNPLNTRTLYAGTSDGLFISTDAGASWSGTALTGTQITLIAIDPQNPQTLYVVSTPSQPSGTAGTITSAILKTTDGGVTFTRLLADDGPFSFVQVDPKTASTVYAVPGIGGAFYKSTDGGATWMSLSTGFLVSQGLNGFAIDPDTPSTLYATTAEFFCCGIPFSSSTGFTPGQFLKSTDAGTTWRQIAAGSFGGPLVVGHGDFYSGTTRSTDGGVTWTQLSAPGSIIAADPSNAALVYAFDSMNRLQISTDAGDTWTPITSSPQQPYTALAAASPTIYLGSSTLNDAFLTKVDAAGHLVYTRLFGGSGYDSATSVALDSTGNIYVAGITTSADFPAVNPLNPFPADLTESTFTHGTAAAFVLQFNSDASSIQFSTSIGKIFSVLNPGISVSSDGIVSMQATSSALHASILKIAP